MGWEEGPECDPPKGAWFYNKMEEVADDAIYDLMEMMPESWGEIVTMLHDDVSLDFIEEEYGEIMLSEEQIAAIREDEDEWERCHDWSQYGPDPEDC